MNDGELRKAQARRERRLNTRSDRKRCSKEELRRRMRVRGELPAIPDADDDSAAQDGSGGCSERCPAHPDERCVVPLDEHAAHLNTEFYAHRSPRGCVWGHEEVQRIRQCPPFSLEERSAIFDRIGLDTDFAMAMLAEGRAPEDIVQILVAMHRSDPNSLNTESDDALSRSTVDTARYFLQRRSR